MSNFDINQYITSRYFYGYQHSELTGDYIEHEFVGVTATSESNPYIIPKCGDSSGVDITNGYKQKYVNYFENSVDGCVES